MLFEITREIAQRMRNLPVEVVFGTGRFERADTVIDNVITVRHVGPESWGPYRGTQYGVAPILFTRQIGVSVYFEVRADDPGASAVDHQRLLATMLQAFMTSLVVTMERRRILLVGGAASSSGHLVNVDDGRDLETGARYEMSFQLATPVPHFEALAEVDASTLTAQSLGVTVDAQTMCIP